MPIAWDTVVDELSYQPDWMTDATLTKARISIVNTWIGYPYFVML